MEDYTYIEELKEKPDLLELQENEYSDIVNTYLYRLNGDVESLKEAINEKEDTIILSTLYNKILFNVDENNIILRDETEYYSFLLTDLAQRHWKQKVYSDCERVIIEPSATAGSLIKAISQFEDKKIWLQNINGAGFSDKNLYLIDFGSHMILQTEHDYDLTHDGNEKYMEIIDLRK